MLRQDAIVSFKLCKFDFYEWNWLPNARLFVVITIFEMEKFLRDFVFSSASSLNLAFYM